ncbi:hypothetical protein HanRHA438_Chr09g0404831 [Helianthus annuus]|nr:hypothetical protein HanIR_Chr09g0423911 [Helianthus annuus]KAJ0888696.1 hypothetical protein HanRHA438_Chr09g0404831 [Helianthus annuus]
MNLIDLANGSGWVGSGHGSKWVRVEMGSGQNGSIKKGLFWFGSKWVRVGTGSGQNGFRVGSVKKMFVFCNTTVMFCIYISAKYQMLQYQVLHLFHMFFYRYRHMCKFVSLI